MLNQLALLKGEKQLAGMLADRDQVIESLVNQVDQMTLQMDRLRKEITELKNQQHPQPNTESAASCQDKMASNPKK